MEKSGVIAVYKFTLYLLAYFRRTKATIGLKRGTIGPRLQLVDDQFSYALSTGVKINELG